MSEDTGKYWRLAEVTEEEALYVRLVGVDDHGDSFPAGSVAMWEAEEHGGLPEWELCPWLQPHKQGYRVVYNALILANALDWSGLSKETCVALRELGVEIPDA